MSELNDDDIQRILKIIDALGDRNVSLEIGDLKLEVTRGEERSPSAGIPRTEASRPPLKVEEGGPATPGSGPAVSPAVTAAAPVKAAVVAGKSRRALEVPEGHTAVSAPTIGTFYRAASPGERPFVEVGDHVGEDDTVGVFDVMKLFTSLRAGVAGTVTAILAENQEVVQQGHPLVLIKPD